MYKSYAKINLVLNVLGKLDNGFHNVDFLMCSVELHDEIYITLSDRDYVYIEDNVEITQENNLAYKALILLKEKYNITNCYNIKIVKKIPIEAGMAGGSSNAATVINVLSKLENLNLSFEEKNEIAIQLGSDVSYCLISKLSRAQGQGEKITVVDSILPNDCVIVVNPGVGLSTKNVYESHHVTSNHQDVEEVIANVECYKNYLWNDLEVTAKGLEPKIKEMIKFVNLYSNSKIIVSGSGPTILVFPKDDQEAEELYNIIKLKYSKTYLTKIRG